MTEELIVKYSSASASVSLYASQDSRPDSGLTPLTEKQRAVFSGSEHMDTASPDLPEMVDSWQGQGGLRPHAQAHLLSSTEYCKVGILTSVVLLLYPSNYQSYF